MKLEVPVVNAFVKSGAGGNSAGVVLDAKHLSDKQMQSIATQVGASETAFVMPSKKATHKIRFFTPTVEVSMCGHATVASWSLINQLGICKPGDYSQETLAGIIDIQLEQSGQVFIKMPTGQLGDLFDNDQLLPALNVSIKDLDMSLQPRFMEKDLMVCLNDEAALNVIRPDFAKLKELSRKFNFYDFHIFVLYDGSSAFAKVRNFCPVLGIPEDAATGTTNGSFLAYLKALGKLPKLDVYKIEQGKAMGRTSEILGKFIDDEVWIGGKAIASKQLKVEI